jgi:hypothetical protein
MILLIDGTGYVGLKFQEILSSRNIEFKNLSRNEGNCCRKIRKRH